MTNTVLIVDQYTTNESKYAHITSKGAFCHDLADPLNSMFKSADPFSASATFLYRPEHFLAVSLHEKKTKIPWLFHKKAMVFIIPGSVVITF